MYQDIRFLKMPASPSLQQYNIIEPHYSTTSTDIINIPLASWKTQYSSTPLRYAKHNEERDITGHRSLKWMSPPKAPANYRGEHTSTGFSPLCPSLRLPKGVSVRHHQSDYDPEPLYTDGKARSVAERADRAYVMAPIKLCSIVATNTHSFFANM